MTHDRWARIRELFDRASELPPEARAALLRSEAADDRSVRDEVTSLLAAFDAAGSSFDDASRALIREAFASGDGSFSGRRVGAYVVGRLLGAGGMGIVYEGHRADAAFDKRVALKFLRGGVTHESAVQRLRLERQILAQLNHPNIASLLDGGITDDGLPYLVMEYVEGVPITDYCDRARSSVRARVRLFSQVCAAVQHAHQHFVIHRDLKPGNILVSADGAVKLLDFGIAKLVHDVEGEAPTVTRGLRAYTPDYASPEQVLGRPMSAATDVYSLGVILYELVAGARPYDTAGRSAASIERLIAEQPPPPPAAVVTDAIAARFEESAARRIQKEIGGDLTSILLTALAKEPELRYGSVDQLGRDLDRWLAGEAVAAHRGWTGYRIRKFVGRHRIETVTVTLLLAALVGGVIATARQARRAERQRAMTDEVNGFLTRMLEAADPQNQGRNVTVAAVLDQAARDVGRRGLDPEVEAGIRQTIGQTYDGLGLYDSAATQLRRAHELRRRLLGPHDRATLVTLRSLAYVEKERGNLAEAERLGRDQLARVRATKSASATDLGLSLVSLASIVTAEGRLPEGDSLNRQALMQLRQAKDSAGQLALAGEAHNYGIAMQYRGDFAAAESLHRESIAIHRRVNGPRSAGYGDAVNGLAALFQDIGRPAAAESLFTEADSVLAFAFGTAHPTALRNRQMHALLRLEQGDFHWAVRVSREIVAHRGRTLPESDITLSSAYQTLGVALDSLGDHVAADSAVRESLALRRKLMPPGHWAIASGEAVLGGHLAAAGRYTEAEPILLEAYRALRDQRGPDAYPTQLTLRRLVFLYQKWGRPAEAAKWRTKLKGS